MDDDDDDDDVDVDDDDLDDVEYENDEIDVVNNDAVIDFSLSFSFSRACSIRSRSLAVPSRPCRNSLMVYRW